MDRGGGLEEGSLAREVGGEGGFCFSFCSCFVFCFSVCLCFVVVFGGGGLFLFCSLCCWSGLGVVLVLSLFH